MFVTNKRGRIDQHTLHDVTSLISFRGNCYKVFRENNSRKYYIKFLVRDISMELQFFWNIFYYTDSTMWNCLLWIKEYLKEMCYRQFSAYFQQHPKILLIIITINEAFISGTRVFYRLMSTTRKSFIRNYTNPQIEHTYKVIQILSFRDNTLVWFRPHSNLELTYL